MENNKDKIEYSKYYMNDIFNKNNRYTSGKGYASECLYKKKNTNNTYKKRKNNICCVNCGERGHVVKECLAPVTSYGIIAFKINYSEKDNNNDINYEIENIFKSENITDIDTSYPKIKFLMIQRKDTMGYIDFLRGKYTSKEKLHICIEEMTHIEKKNILLKTFDELWNELWICTKFNNIGNPMSNFYKQDYYDAKNKFSKLNIQELFTDTSSKYCFSEFTLPKGRQNLNESKLECAKREFTEETRLSDNDYVFMENYPVIEEQFTGTNGIKYKHIYYLVQMKNSKQFLPKIEGNIQLSEVKNIGWFSKYECLCLIRPYDNEKKKIITDVHNNILDFYKSCKLN